MDGGVDYGGCRLEREAEVAIDCDRAGDDASGTGDNNGTVGAEGMGKSGECGEARADGAGGGVGSCERDGEEEREEKGDFCKHRG